MTIGRGVGGLLAMTTQRSIAASVLFVALLASDAVAQSVYIDFGGGPPSSTYAAASGVPGYWNEGHMPSPVTPLLGLQQQATQLTYEALNSYGGHWNFPTTTGDDEALLDDWHYGDSGLGGLVPTTVKINGLAAGTYQLFAYIKGDGGSVGGFTHINMTLGAGGTFDGPAGISFPWYYGPFPGWNTGWPVGLKIMRLTATSTLLTMRFGAEVADGASGIQLLRLGDVTPSFCSGDGSGLACPCGNTGLSGHGCANSFYPDGGLLVASGNASVAADTLVLAGANMSGYICFFLQGTAQTQSVINDGLLCLAGSLIRIGVKPVWSGTSLNPSGVDLPLSVKGAIPAGGGTRYYQGTYRNAVAYCTPGTTNRTNGITVVWLP